MAGNPGPYYLERLAALVDMFGTAVGSRSARTTSSRPLPAQGPDGWPRCSSRPRAGLPRPTTFDNAGEPAIKDGGQVIVVPAARMPTRTGIAAIYRY